MADLTGPSRWPDDGREQTGEGGGVRTVSGATDRVVIVGAGLGGLACALHLAGAGREVTVVEREPVPGGRAGRLALGGYEFDTGPTVLTMPELIDQALDAVDESASDWLDLAPLDPAYRAHFPDGSTLDVLTHTARLAGEFFRDPRTRRVFSFQAMYAGLAPHDALALYAVIAYLDAVCGVYFPRGGVHAVPRALAGAAEKHGVRFRYDTTVSYVDGRGDRATGVVTADGERIPADVVVLNPDLPVAYRDLLPSTPRRVRRLRHSPSAVVLHVGSTQRYARIAHHNLHFGRSWRGTFDEVLRRGELMSDPSLLVSNPTRTDPSMAPTGREVYYVLAPVPNLQVSTVDWRGKLGREYAGELIATLEARGYYDFGAGVEVSHVVTPAQWADAGMAAGTPFAAAHTFTQTGPFRPGNLHPTLSNVVFVGSGTRPGVGVPMVLISGKLAAGRVTGATR